MSSEAVTAPANTPDKDNHVCYSFRKTSGTYNVAEDCDFYQFCETIYFKGFNRLPKGFYKNGYGFAKPASTFLTSVLKPRLGNKIKITISKADASSLKREKKSYNLTFNHADYISILETIRAINAEKNQRSNQHVLSELGSVQYLSHIAKLS